MYAALVFYAVITFVFIYLQVSSIQSLSLKTHFQDIWNIADAFITTVALFSLIIFFVRHQYVYSLLQSLLIADDDVHVSFTEACGIDFLLTYTIAFLCVAAILRIWRILRYLECFYIFEQTFVYAAASVGAVLFIMSIFLIGFSCFVFLTMGSHFGQFLSPVSSLVTLVSMAIGQNAGIDYDLFISIDQVIGPLIYLTFAIVSVIFLTNVCTAVIMEYYSVSKEAKERTREVRTYSFADYIRDEYNYHFQKKHGPQNWEKERLRGGGDDGEDIYSEFPSNSEVSTSPNYSLVDSTTREKLSTQNSNIESKKSDINENNSTEIDLSIENQTIIYIQEQLKKCKTGTNYLFSKNLPRNILFKKRKSGISRLKDMFRNSILHDHEICVANNETIDNCGRKKIIINTYNTERTKSHGREQGRRKIIQEQEIKIFNDQLDVLSDQLGKVIRTVTINKHKLQAMLQKKRKMT